MDRMLNAQIECTHIEGCSEAWLATGAAALLTRLPALFAVGDGVLFSIASRLMVRQAVVAGTGTAVVTGAVTGAAPRAQQGCSAGSGSAPTVAVTVRGRSPVVVPDREALVTFFGEPVEEHEAFTMFAANGFARRGPSILVRCARTFGPDRD